MTACGTPTRRDPIGIDSKLVGMRANIAKRIRSILDTIIWRIVRLLLQQPVLGPKAHHAPPRQFDALLCELARFATCPAATVEKNDGGP